MIFVQLLLRQWRQRPARNLLSLLSIAIAVAAVLGTRVAQTSVRSSYRNLTQAVATVPAIDIVSTAGGRFPIAELPALGDIAGIAESAPIVARATSGRVSGTPFRMLLVGLSPESTQLWKSLTLTTGALPAGENEALITDEVAKSLAAGVGDRVVVLTRRGPRFATIAGMIPSASIQEIVPGGSLVLRASTVQQWFGLGDQVDRVRVLLAHEDDRKAVETQLAERLPESFARQHPMERAELINSVLRSTELALRFAGLLSLALAGFIVLNTLRMNFGERRKQLATLRVIGATSGQMMWLHLLEGAVLGITGTAVGIPLGVFLGKALTTVMQRIVGENVPTADLEPRTLIVAAIGGPLVAVVAALVPAFFARRVSPGEALGDQELRQGERFPLWAIVTAGVLWITAAVLLTLVIRKDLAPDFAMPAGLLMLVAFIALLPAILKPLINLFSKPLTAWLGIESNLAAGQLLRRPTRTGLTVGLLVVVLSNGLGLGNAVINNVDDIYEWQRRSLAGDFLISDPSAKDTAAGARTSMRDAIQSLDGVSSVVGIRLLTARAAGIPAMCVVRDFPAEVDLPWPLPASEEAAVRAGLKQGDTVVSSVVSGKLGLKVGDELRIEVQGRVQSSRIAATVNDYTLGGMVVILDNEAASKSFDTGLPEMCIVRTEPGQHQQVDEQLVTLAREQGLVMQSFAEIRGRLEKLINGVVGALWGLLALGFVVGGFGIGNTLTMSVLEQTRELGLLRIIGMTQSQIFKIVFCEALYFALTACVLGTIAGVTTAYTIYLTNEPLMGRVIPFVLKWSLLGTNAAICVAVALAASLLPGRRVAKLNLLEALAYE